MSCFEKLDTFILKFYIFIIFEN